MADTRVYQLSMDIQLPVDKAGEFIDAIVRAVETECEATMEGAYVRGWSQEYSWSTQSYDNGCKEDE